ncbi:uncharacterized protein At5g43822-like [Papaver somniferum]|uniref:uncharacterized protein At5g43822-like n=1 Tax=Papaver somniferum TaxID=3469 RepID=UPI000E6F8C6D|nr:uncharacterized protein At5g43822-like [Papaver somniferum]XP_026390712.1 uncharacterized protein At5g43822-like [Papaver somniferum]
MEMMVKKYLQKYKKVREEMDKWDQLQSRLLTQFRNASAIIERLQVLEDNKYYCGSLRSINGLKETLYGKQRISLETILRSMDETMGEFCSIVVSLNKIVRDSKELVKGGSVKLSKNLRQTQIGITPSIAYCLEGLEVLHEMHHSEYLLKLSVISAIPSLMLKKASCAGDLAGLRQLLVDQPNIPKGEVQQIFDIIFADQIE